MAKPNESKRILITPDTTTQRILQKNGNKGLYIYKHKNGKWYSASGEEIPNFKNTSGSSTLKKVSNKPIEALRNLIKENKKPIVNEEQPITLDEVVVIGKSKPKSTTSRGMVTSKSKSTTSRGTITPTPTTGRRYGARSIDDAFSHYKLTDDHRKYLDSLNVGNDINKLLGILNVTLDSLWGDKTNEAFINKYKEWKAKQTAPTERPLSQIDPSLAENWFKQYMLQSQRRPILAMPATYDRYDIRHWLRENDIKGVTAGGRKALRHYLNGEDYDTRYLGIIDLYAPMIRGNQQQLRQSTPIPDPAWLDYLNNMMGQSFLNLGNTRPRSYDDMYYYSNLPQRTTSTSSWRPNSWTNKAQELRNQINQFNFTPQYSTPTYFSNDEYLGPFFTKKGGKLIK